MTRVALLAAVALAAGGGAAAQRTDGPTERYDQYFRKYSKRYFGPGWDWRVFKAQALAESRLNPEAVSWVGARGLMQLMPSTYAAIQTKDSTFGSIDDPEWNIAAGIRHDRSMWRLWSGQVLLDDRLTFMFGSYNSGRSPIVRAQGVAQTRAYDPRLWSSVEAVAPDVPRWRHDETLGYVRKIEEYRARLDSKGRLRKA